MAKLIYSVITSLDGFVEDERGTFGWGAPADEAVHACVNELASSVGTYLYGRRMYETMVFWETAHTLPDGPLFILEFARVWQRAEKVVYSEDSIPNGGVRGRGSSGRSTPTRSGGSRPTPSAISRSTVPRPRRRCGPVLSTNFR